MWIYYSLSSPPYRKWCDTFFFAFIIIKTSCANVIKVRGRSFCPDLLQNRSRGINEFTADLYNHGPVLTHQADLSVKITNDLPLKHQRCHKHCKLTAAAWWGSSWPFLRLKVVSWQHRQRWQTCVSKGPCDYQELIGCRNSGKLVDVDNAETTRPNPDEEWPVSELLVPFFFFCLFCWNISKAEATLLSLLVSHSHWASVCRKWSDCIFFK